MIKNKLSIGIVTVYKLNNFGSSLQAFALKSFLEKCGYSVFILCLRNKSLYIRIHKLIQLIMLLFKNPFILKYFLKSKNNKDKMALCLKTEYLFKQFTKDYLNENIFTYNELKKRARDKDVHAFICGSDQDWSLSSPFLNPIYFLRFAPRSKRISYAPSFGISKIPNHHFLLLKRYLKGFDNISIRELHGAKCIKDLTCQHAYVVLDPTLLLPRSFWDNKSINLNIPKPYIACYFLNEPSDTAIDCLNFINTFFKYKILILPYHFNKFNKFNNLENLSLSPFEFIDFIKNASFVLTDSFHGVSFSINFNVPFFVFKRQYKYRFNESCRITSILSILKLENRWIDSCDSLSFNSFYLNYHICNYLLKKERKKSLNYIFRSLKTSNGV